MRKPIPKPANTTTKPKLVAKTNPQSAPTSVPAELEVARTRPEPDDVARIPTKFKDLVERVAAATGQKTKDVREVVTATLDELGKALEQGEALNLPPFGKIKISRTRSLVSGSAMTLKLRRGAGGGGGNGGNKGAKTALVDSVEDS